MVLVLSKYERVQIVAGRVEQLLAGAPKLISDEGITDVEVIAEQEVERRLLPLRIARTMPNGKRRIYDLADFLDPASSVTPAVVAVGV